MTHQRSVGGFTLVEVMVALSVTVLAIASATAIIAQAHQQLAMTGQLQQAHYRAASHLNALGAQPLAAGRQHGVYGSKLDSELAPLTDMRWVLDLTPIVASDLAPEISTLSTQVRAFRAELAVFIHGSSRQIQVSSVVFSPSVPAETSSAGDENEDVTVLSVVRP